MGLETDLSVPAEINLYYDLHVPDGASGAGLLVAVHGYGAHKRHMMREAKLVAPEDFVIASLQAPHPHYRRTEDGAYKIGFGWLSDFKPEEDVRLHHEFVNDVIRDLSARSTIDPGRVCMYGFSQACALNFRYAFTFPDILRCVIGVCGGIPGDLDANTAYKAPSSEVHYLFGDDDEFYSQEQFADFDAKLRQRIPNYSSKHYNARHEITQEMRSDVRDLLRSV